MSANTVDYDALAKQYGAVSSVPASQSGVDYDALAKQYGALSSVAETQQEQPQPGWGQRIMNTGADVGMGITKGAWQTALTLSSLLNKIPYVGETLAPSQGITAGQQLAQPQNTAEKVGMMGEQIGEMALTGSPLRAGATALPRYIAPVARIGAEALNAAGSAYLHGQPVGTSAALGAGGGAVGEAAQALAPKIAEAAIGITQRLRRGGKQVGQAILDETSAVTPGGVAEQSKQVIRELSKELEARADAAGQQGVTASTKQALDYLDNQIAKYQGRNSPLAKKLMDLREQLTTNQYTGAAIPQDIAPRDILELKRGVGDTIGSWEPSLRKTAQPIQQRVYSLLDNELDRTVPGAQQLNERMSNLIPGSKQAARVADSASLPQRVLHRAAAHTGALTGAAAGAGIGYYRGGPEGAVEYGLAGLVGPELLASPAGQMAAARLMKSGAPWWLARTAIAAQSQRYTLSDLLK